MVPKWESKGEIIDLPHRVVVIDNVISKNGLKIYYGFVLSSQIANSNKNNPQYPEKYLH